MTILGNLRILLLILPVVVVLALIGSPQSAETQGTAGAITGYAWSDTVGWLSLNCSNHGTCGTSNYGLSVSDSGSVSGYGWSDNVGWVSANSADLTGCPQAPCTARITNGQLLGWMKVIAAGGAQSGGWDGFIALGDTNTGDANSYGVSLSGGNFSGYAWGDTVVGWLDFSYADTSYAACSLTQGYACVGNVSRHTDAQCVIVDTDCSTQGAGWFCGDSGLCVPPPDPTGALSFSPQLVPTGGTTVVSWDADNTSVCTITGTNGDAWTGGASGSQTSGAINEVTTYTLTCEDSEGNPLFVAEGTVSVVPTWVER